MIFERLPDALEWLDSHIDYESKVPTRRSLPSLTGITQLLGLLGDPQDGYPVIHVTGTNGKGSTVAMIERLLGRTGLSVGTYTSPNLSRVNERLSLRSEPIDDASFCAQLSHLASIELHLDEPSTRFELLTAAALRWFSDEAVDVAVVEVGLGGTWDATNVVTGEVAVITSVSLDHVEVLGSTEREIAEDKAGIVKEGATVIVGAGPGQPEVVEVIREVSRRAGAGTILVRGEDFECRSNRLAVGGRVIDLTTPGAIHSEVFVGLHGAHQGENAACAVMAVEAFLGHPLDDEVIGEALAEVSVPGRLEVAGRRPLVLLDGAHNAGGIAALAGALAEEFAEVRPIVGVVGILEGRDPAAILGPLRDVGMTTLIACPPPSPRAFPGADLAEIARGLGIDATSESDVDDAVEAGRATVREEGMLLVCGSLYVVARARELLRMGA